MFFSNLVIFSLIRELMKMRLTNDDQFEFLTLSLHKHKHDHIVTLK